jgi:hypothetical protein
MKKMIITLGFMLVWACAVLAQGPEIAWEETFDDPDCLARANFQISHRYGPRGWDGSLLIKELKGGTFRYGLKHDKVRYAPGTGRNDQVHLKYGLGWGADSPEWGPFDLRKYPIVEIRWRGNPVFMHLPYSVETASGNTQNSYVQLGARGKDPKEWRVDSWRVAPDTSVPGPETAIKLTGIDPMILKPPGEDSEEGSDSVMEIDYIRVRGFTAAEAAEEVKVTGVLEDFPEVRWEGLDDFFPWGMFAGYFRSVFEYWGGDYEGAYGNYVRHHFNFMPSNDEVEFGRAGHDPERYINAMQPLVDSARATGMYLAADVRRMIHAEPDKMLPMMKQIVKAFSDDDVVIAWNVADEPSPPELIPVARMIRTVHEADPLKRPVLATFNSTGKFGPFVPYLDISYWDHYPIRGNSRDPWSTRQIAREYRKRLPGKPAWALLPAFENYPPVHTGFARPSDAELRLMCYLSIAEGAKGILWFIGWHVANEFIGSVDRTGLGHGGMMDSMSDLGERLVPIGKQLLPTDPVDDPKIKVVQLIEPKEEGHLLAVSVLKHRKDKLHFLVAVNEDLDRPRSAKVDLDSTILSSGQGVYDIYTLDGKNLAGSEDRTFTVSPLAGGDGRLYVVCDNRTFEKVRAKILCAKASEAARVLKPDTTIARRWGLDLADVDRAVESCMKSAKANSGEQALSQARLAGVLLFDKIKSDSELNAIRRAFSDMQKELAETSSITEYWSTDPKWWHGRDNATWIPNPGFADLSERYWRVGRSYRDCYKDYLKGNKEGLWEKVNKARNECLEMRVDVLAFLRETLKPATEPPVQKPNMTAL